MDLTPLFRSVNETESHPSGTTVFKKGEPADTMYVVKEGMVQLVINDVVIEDVGPGGVLGRWP